MTKEEIKLIKEQQAQIEKGYKYQIKRLEEDLQTAKGELSTAAEQVDTLSGENEALRSQIQHLQSGLSGEEISTTKIKARSYITIDIKGGDDTMEIKVLIEAPQLASAINNLAAALGNGAVKAPVAKDVTDLSDADIVALPNGKTLESTQCLTS